MTSRNYADYLFSNAGGAILTWMVEGAVRVINAEFRITLPACVQEAIKAYRGENDWLGHFLADRCDLGSNLTEKIRRCVYRIPSVLCGDW